MQYTYSCLPDGRVVHAAQVVCKNGNTIRATYETRSSVLSKEIQDLLTQSVKDKMKERDWVPRTT